MAMPTDIEIVDLGIGFPYTSVEQKMASYDFFRANLKDEQSKKEMEFPVQYMFKGVPDIVPEDTDIIEWTVEKMDAYNIRIARVGLIRIQLNRRQHLPLRLRKQSTPLIGKCQIEMRFGMIATEQHRLPQTSRRGVQLAGFELGQPQVQEQVPIF